MSKLGEGDICAHVFDHRGGRSDDPNFFVRPRASPATRPSDGRRVVLLVHGASASSRTFDIPKGGLRSYLQENGFDVYSIDWRSSMLTVNQLVQDGAPADEFTMDAAIGDLTAGLDWVQKQAEVPKDEISVVGHCVGGALVAQAVASGVCHSRRVVLTTLTLFHRVGLEGWLKGNDSVLEELYLKEPARVVSAEVARDPKKHPWPPELEERYKIWLASGIPHECTNEFCHRVSFMYGMPYRPDDIRYLHDGEEGGLPAQFGAMPMGIYVHCTRSLRRGWIAPFDGRDPFKYLNAKPFAGKRITLVTGNENQVWHRDSIDRMYAWLVDELPQEKQNFVKHVLPRYGHQDLYWSTKARTDVYPKILAGLL